ncbi:hypothetical protein ACFYVL_14245 [Streptomyces sp. NPDC004111]|uniref:hypothetical protein n=1 Tax=Streptomyces sp. NPDC004111 TaxID=3364690 RepID=UPI00369D32CA
MADHGLQPELCNHHDDPGRPWVYVGALVAGVALVVVGDSTPVEACTFLTPLLAVFEQRRI